jgi:hypothetical protein
VVHCRHAHCDGRDRLFFLRRMLEQGWLAPADLIDPDLLTGSNSPPRTVIRYEPGEIAAVVDHAEEALLLAGPDLYQRGTTLVRPGVARICVDGDDGPGHAQRVFEVGDRALVEAMSIAADWERFDKRSDRWVRIDAPLAVASTYLQRVGHWKLPVLTAIVDAPTLRPDGSVLATPGYDPATGLLFDPRGTSFPPVPIRPTRRDAEDAVRVLLCLVETFPFVGPADRSSAVSAFLTASIRRSLPAAPMHAYTAPTAGSGKSMLVDLTSVIATGREAAVIAQGKSEEELEKRLGALLLAGDPVIAIDNCEAPLSSEFLCSMLTQQAVRPRILGRSEAPVLPASAMVTATGNNLVLEGDLTRRAILCRLDPGHERPELRAFESHPVRTAKARRGEYLVAALTVLRAYHLAGRPGAPQPLGFFEDWSGWVRGALVWLGLADSVATMEAARGMDPRLDALTAGLTQWRAVIGGERVSCRAVIERATRQATPVGAFGAFGRPEFVHPDFREALLAVAGEGGVVNGRRLSKWIAAHEDRIVHGMRIVRCGMLSGFMTWRLECVE